MIRKKNPTTLEAALQAQVASIDGAKRKLATAVELADRKHYIAVDEAKKARRKELIAVEDVFEKRQKSVERAWSLVFRRALNANARFTKKAYREDQDAVNAEVSLQSALPFIRKEVPRTLAGLKDVLADMQTACRSRRVAAGKNLSQRHDQAAQKERKEIPEAKRKRDKETAAIKRELKAAKRPVEARFRLAVRAANAQLRQKKADAKQAFEQSSQARQEAWADFAQTTESAQQSLLCALDANA